MHAGQEEGEKFTIEGPVADFRIAFEVVTEGRAGGSGTKKIDFKSIDLVLEEDKIVIESESAAF